jgi:DNA-binding NarL/FixJ family response regulator
MIRAYLIDDHTAVRQAVATMLETADDIEVVGQAGDAPAGIAEVAALRPDVVLLDLKLPGLGGLSAIPQIQQVASHSKIVVFTMYDNPAFVWETVNAGAAGTTSPAMPSATTA